MADSSFHCELEKSKEKDEHGNQVTTIKCHGKLISDTASEVKELVAPSLLAAASLSTLVT
jgi:hypothetical protein